MDLTRGVWLVWLPLGAGGRVVARCGRAFEAVAAWRAGRPAAALFHAALLVETGEGRVVVEQAPAWGGPAGPRGVVVEGPVGLRPLGRWRLFRYEVRRWRGGIVPDLPHAVGPPQLVGDDVALVRGVLDAVPRCPALTWGRDERGLGEMWNSNAVIAWVLAEAGVDPLRWAPPDGGRAPGWRAGAALARGAGAPRRARGAAAG